MNYVCEGGYRSFVDIRGGNIFGDGFGGGTNRARVLEIMKDSHIGSYGVIGLIGYFALLYATLSALPAAWVGMVLLAGDPFCKAVSAQIINVLPYARKEAEAKNLTVYSRMTPLEWVTCLMAGGSDVQIALPHKSIAPSEGTSLRNNRPYSPVSFGA